MGLAVHLHHVYLDSRASVEYMRCLSRGIQQKNEGELKVKLRFLAPSTGIAEIEQT